MIAAVNPPSAIVTSWTDSGVLRLDRPVPVFPPSARMSAMLTRVLAPAGEPDRWRQLTRERLARRLGLPADWIVIGESLEALLTAVLDAHPRDGPVFTFEPTALTAVPLVRECGREVTAWPRSHRFAVELTAKESRHFPSDAVALLMSPNDPTGTLTSIQDVVRLARRCALVAVDERYADPLAPSVVPLVREVREYHRASRRGRMVCLGGTGASLRRGASGRCRTHQACAARRAGLCSNASDPQRA
ncbi:MAG: hypothetical protein C4345_12520 [Chloroflexota bacterium]